MESLTVLLENLVNLIESCWDVAVALFHVIAPYAALLAWIAFWTLAVNWEKLYVVLVKQGGMVGVGLIAAVMWMIWCSVAPPNGGSHEFFGVITVGNYLGKFVFVSFLFTIMFLCGAVQLSGCCDKYLCFEEPAESDAHGHH